MITRNRIRLAVLCPVLSLLVAGGIVSNQYARRDRLARELRQTEQEIARIESLLSPDMRQAPQHHHDDEDADHKD